MSGRYTGVVEAARGYRDLHARAEKLCLNPDQIRKAEMPYEFSDGKVQIHNSHKWKKEEIPSQTTRICQHCVKELEIDKSGAFISTVCVYHPKATRPGCKWQCCDRSYRSSGCKTQVHHVHCGNLRTDVTGYIEFTAADPTKKGKIYALDTERVFTKRGMQAADVTIIDTQRQVVYKTVITPDTDILDYNTKFSGLTAEDFEKDTKTLEEVHEDLKDKIFSDTILVGHGLSSDLRALKICHAKVIDTSVVYTNSKNPLNTPGLKQLTEEHLGRLIQQGDGHDSGEDAMAAMDLVLLKIGLET